MRRAPVFRLFLIISAALAGVILLFSANWMFTPEVVGITKLESFFRPRHQLPFDPEKWRNHQNVKWGVRYEMTDQLLEKQFLEKLTRDEVRKLLGVPDIESTFPSGEINLIYNLGSQKDYPSRSIFFPGRLENLELWVLLIRIRSDMVYSVEIAPT